MRRRSSVVQWRAMLGGYPTLSGGRKRRLDRLERVLGLRPVGPAGLPLALVGEAAQVFQVDAGNHARDQLHAIDLAHAVIDTLGAATAHGQFLFRLAEFAL